MAQRAHRPRRRVTNLGRGSVEQTFLIQAYVSTDSLLSADEVQNDSIPTGDYAGGQTAATVTGATDLAGLAPGRYHLILPAHYNRQVLESNKRNDRISAPFTISAYTPAISSDIDLSLAIAQSTAASAWR